MPAENYSVTASAQQMMTMMMNPKHEAKQKLNGAVQRFNRAVKNHPNEEQIRQSVRNAIAEGADAIDAFNTGITMSKNHSGKITLQGDEGEVNIQWGWFCSTETSQTTN